MGVNDSDHTEQAMHLLNGVGKLVGNLKSENKENDVPIETVKKTRPVPMPSLAKFKVVGEMGSGFRPRADDVQDFYKIRDSCLASGQLFEDCEFDAVKSSLVFSKSPSISKSLDVKSIKWKRPKEIINDPQFFVKGANRFDVKQGKLGDCWLNAAVANLTLQEHLFQQVVPNDQSFQHNYAGIFHFRFWQYGHWVDVVIDDRLPTYHGNLVFMHSNEQNEFWSALLEKAYAKLHGSYEALKHGNAFEALEDFTGGVTEYFKLRDKAPSNLFKIMEKAHERSSLMSCSIYFLNDRGVIIICIGLLRNDYLQLVPINYTNFNSKLPFVYQYTIYHRTVENEQALTPEGLVRRHAYSITEIKLVDIATPNETSKIPLLRLRNPWGNKVEWNGAWSDKSPEWQRIPESVKQEMGLTFSYDGEFWMSYRDFAERFDQLEICNLSPDSLVENVLTEHDKKKWEMSVFEGEWVRGATAGGCRNYLETFWHNPQYIITLNDPDEDDEEDKCTVLVALTQKNRRKMGAKSLYIGFAVYHLEGADNLPKPLDLNFFKYNVYVAKTKSFTNQREVTARFKLPPGVYCIVPSTFEPNKEGEFLLRVFSETKNHMEENDEKVGMGEIDNRVKVEDDEPEKNKAADDIREFFKKLAGDDMEVDWMELKQILDYAMKTDTQPEGFSKDVCRSMIAMLDIDRSGKLGFEELKQLLVEIMTWKFVYKMYCKEETGYLSAFEMRQALNSAGYRLNNHILNILVHRYASKEGKISFDDFVMCAIRLKFMIDQFKGRDPNNTNEATFKIDEWVEMTLYS